jgi:large subunit ribosomal protein L23
VPKEVDPYGVLRRPLGTEKSTMLQDQNKYSFEVADGANKIQIKQAVEMAFDVNVVKVNVMRMSGKMRRMGRHQGMTRSWKKAIVTLQEGDRIELFEGV